AWCVPVSSSPISRLKPATSACRMAASFRLREDVSPGEPSGLSSGAPIVDAYDLTADHEHYSQLRSSLTMRCAETPLTPFRRTALATQFDKTELIRYIIVNF